MRIFICFVFCIHISICGGVWSWIFGEDQHAFDVFSGMYEAGSNILSEAEQGVDYVMEIVREKVGKDGVKIGITFSGDGVQSVQVGHTRGPSYNFQMEFLGRDDTPLKLHIFSDSDDGKASTKLTTEREHIPDEGSPEGETTVDSQSEADILSENFEILSKFYESEEGTKLPLEDVEQILRGKHPVIVDDEIMYVENPYTKRLKIYIGLEYEAMRSFEDGEAADVNYYPPNHEYNPEYDTGFILTEESVQEITLYDLFLPVGRQVKTVLQIGKTILYRVGKKYAQAMFMEYLDEKKPKTWGVWEDLEKVRIGETEYAKVGGRLWSKQAVEISAKDKLNLPPRLVEGTIQNRLVKHVGFDFNADGVPRKINHYCSYLSFTTDRDGKLIEIKDWRED